MTRDPTTDRRINPTGSTAFVRAKIVKPGEPGVAHVVMVRDDGEDDYYSKFTLRVEDYVDYGPRTEGGGS